jgi:hypothetical protein
MIRPVLAATDLTLPVRTNRMRYHKTICASKWKLKIMRGKFFLKNFAPPEKNFQNFISPPIFLKLPEIFAKNFVIFSYCGRKIIDSSHELPVNWWTKICQ